MKYWKRVRTAVFAIAIAGPLGFGVLQATTASADPQPVGCKSFACRTECAPFGGDLVPGGPGKPLRCACCG